jgi:anti-sigma28 factor (negative regulator of flagellin synthesis)
MKIHPNLPTPPVSPGTTPEPPAVERSEDPEAARVQLSDDARWISQVSEEARRAPEVRADVVDAARRSLADGTWQTSVDWEKVVDRLLADL